MKLAELKAQLNILKKQAKSSYFEMLRKSSILAKKLKAVELKLENAGSELSQKHKKDIQELYEEMLAIQQNTYSRKKLDKELSALNKRVIKLEKKLKKREDFKKELNSLNSLKERLEKIESSYASRIELGKLRSIFEHKNEKLRKSIESIGSKTITLDELEEKLRKEYKRELSKFKKLFEMKKRLSKLDNKANKLSESIGNIDEKLGSYALKETTEQLMQELIGLKAASVLRNDFELMQDKIDSLEKETVTKKSLGKQLKKIEAFEQELKEFRRMKQENGKTKDKIDSIIKTIEEIEKSFGSRMKSFEKQLSGLITVVEKIKKEKK